MAVIFTGAVKTATEMEPVFNVAPDWYRLNGYAWLVRTDESADTWSERLKPYLNGGSVFIVEVDLQTRWGIHSKQFWGWLDKYR